MRTIMRLLKIVLLNLILMSFGLSGCASTNATAKEMTAKAKIQEKSNLETLTCWDVITLPEEDSNFAMVLLYGYHAGKNNQPVQPAKKIARIILDAVKICDKNPDMTVIGAIQSLDK